MESSTTPVPLERNAGDSTKGLLLAHAGGSDDENTHGSPFKACEAIPSRCEGAVKREQDRHRPAGLAAGVVPTTTWPVGTLSPPAGFERLFGFAARMAAPLLAACDGGDDRGFDLDEWSERFARDG